MIFSSLLLSLYESHGFTCRPPALVSSFSPLLTFRALHGKHHFKPWKKINAKNRHPRVRPTPGNPWKIRQLIPGKGQRSNRKKIPAASVFVTGKDERIQGDLGLLILATRNPTDQVLLVEPMATRGTKGPMCTTRV